MCVRQAPGTLKVIINYFLARTKDNVTSISFHPEENRIALGNIVGEVSLFSLTNKVISGFRIQDPVLSTPGSGME